MTVDEAIRDLLTISTDIRRVVVLSAAGEVLGAGPEPPGTGVAEAAGQLWEAAARRAAAVGSSPLDHIVVQDPSGGVAVLQQEGRRIVASTGPAPAVGLLLFDLRTCLTDAKEEGS